MQTRVISFLFFTLIVVVFSVLNIQPVVIDFYFAQTNVALIFVIIFSILIGAILMYILSSMKFLKTTRKMKQVEKENERLHQEVKDLSKLVEKGNTESHSEVESTGQTESDEQQ